MKMLAWMVYRDLKRRAWETRAFNKLGCAVHLTTGNINSINLRMNPSWWGDIGDVHSRQAPLLLAVCFLLTGGDGYFGATQIAQPFYPRF